MGFYESCAMSVVKNQHYVPQFYLRLFSQDGNLIYAYDNVDKMSFPSSVSSVALMDEQRTRRMLDSCSTRSANSWGQDGGARDSTRSRAWERRRRVRRTS